MTRLTPPIPLMGFAAPSGTGKTTLMEGVIAQLSQGGLRVAAIKHGHHPADPDVPGKDTHRFRQAGAETVVFSCRERWFLIQETPHGHEPTLEEQAQHLGGHDLILVEGFKNHDHPKIAIYRQEFSQPGFIQNLSGVVAIATDDMDLSLPFPLLPLENPQEVAQFIRRYLKI